MSRKFISCILMLCMFWQALAFAGAGVLVADAQEQAHELLHFQGEPHHHDEHQGGLHEDDSLASNLHILMDCGVCSVALLPSMGAPVVAAPQDRPPTDMALVWPFADVDGLERPPRLTA